MYGRSVMHMKQLWRSQKSSSQFTNSLDMWIKQVLYVDQMCSEYLFHFRYKWSTISLLFLDQMQAVSTVLLFRFFDIHGII